MVTVKWLKFVTHRGVGLSCFAAADIGVVWHGACSLRRVHDVCSEPRLKRSVMMKLGQVLPQTHRFITHWYLYKFWLLGIHNVQRLSIVDRFSVAFTFTYSTWSWRGWGLWKVWTDRYTVLNRLLLSQWMKIRKGSYFDIVDLGILLIARMSGRVLWEATFSLIYAFIGSQH